MGENAMIRIYLVRIRDTFYIVKNFATLSRNKNGFANNIYIAQTFDARWLA